MKLINDVKNFIKKSPVVFFIGLLLVLFALIYIGNKFRVPKMQVSQNQEMVKNVSVFDFKDNPRLNIQAKVDKENIVELIAQKSGIIKRIYVDNGQNIFSGNSIAYISDIVGGVSSASVGLEIAKRQEEASDENIKRQEKIFKKQKEIIDHTSAPTKNAERQEYIDKKQISVNKENAKLANEMSEFSLKQAQISAELARVSAPQNGTVEKIFVNPGQFVLAGTPIALFRSEKGSLLLEAKVSIDVASIISTEEYSMVNIAGEEVEIKPIYISSEATDSYLYSIIFCLDEKYSNSIANESFVSINIPLDRSVSENYFHPLVSLDTLQITQEGAFAFVFEDGVARSRELDLGKVFGQYVEVISGLSKEDKVIINRNVFFGDRVSIDAS